MDGIDRYREGDSRPGRTPGRSSSASSTESTLRRKQDNGPGLLLDQTRPSKVINIEAASRESEAACFVDKGTQRP